MLCGRACVSKTSKQTKRNRTLGASDSWNAGNQDLRSGYKGFSFPQVKWRPQVDPSVIKLSLCTNEVLILSCAQSVSIENTQECIFRNGLVTSLEFPEFCTSQRTCCFSLRRTLPGVSVSPPVRASRIPDLEAVRKRRRVSTLALLFQLPTRIRVPVLGPWILPFVVAWVCLLGSFVGLWGRCHSQCTPQFLILFYFI